MIENQKAKAKRNGRTISTDTAYEEVVADAMEKMLLDENFVERMQELKKTDKSLWEKLKDFFKRLLDAFEKASKDYQNMGASTVESVSVEKFSAEARKRLAQMYAEAFTDAAEKHSSAENVGVNIDTETELSDRDDEYLSPVGTVQ